MSSGMVSFSLVPLGIGSVAPCYSAAISCRNSMHSHASNTILVRFLKLKNPAAWVSTILQWRHHANLHSGTAVTSVSDTPDHAHFIFIICDIGAHVIYGRTPHAYGQQVTQLVLSSQQKHWNMYILQLKIGQSMLHNVTFIILLFLFFFFSPLLCFFQLWGSLIFFF